MLNGATCLKLFVSVYLMNLINVALGGFPSSPFLLSPNVHKLHFRLVCLVLFR